MATVRIVARKDKAQRGGDDLAAGRASTTWPIYLRVTHEGTIYRLSLGLRVRAADWNEEAQASHWVRKTHPEHVRINRFLSGRLATAQAERATFDLSGKAFTAGELRDAIEHALNGTKKPDRKGQAIPYFWDLADGYEREGKFASAERYRQMIRKLEAFQRNQGEEPERLAFAGITTAYLRRWREYLAEEEELAHNTVAKHLRGLRTLYYTARREKKASGDNAFEHITITEKPSAKISLTRAELEQLAAADVPTKPQQTYVAPAVARDLFLFATYAQGVRRSDCLLLAWDNLEWKGKLDRERSSPVRLRYTMRKNSKPRSVKLTTPAQEITLRYADRRGTYSYIFPVMDGWALASAEAEYKALNKMGEAVNIALREAAREAGIGKKSSGKRLTFHVARHTFARLADEAGWPLRKIQAALGHGTSKTTERYLRSVRGEDLDSDMDELFG